MITLYPDQQAGMAAIRQAYIAGKRAPLFVAPCAFGKTVVFSAMAHGAIRRGKTVMIVAHRTELLDQISDTLTAFNVRHGFIAANRPYVIEDVMVASAQTLRNRLKSYVHAPSLLILDECHHTTLTNTRPCCRLPTTGCPCQ